MRDWNVIVSTYDRGFAFAIELLSELGPVARTDFFNVLVLKVDDIERFLAVFAEWAETMPMVLAAISRVSPVRDVFNFQSAAEFEDKAREVVLARLGELAGKSFHVRMHRRGFKGRLSSQDEERFLDQAILDALARDAMTAKISFEDPDVIVAIETVAGRGGIAFWSRAQRQRYRFLKLD